MNEHQQAELLARWLDAGGPPPDGLDADAVEAMIALRPSLAAPPALDLDALFDAAQASPAPAAATPMPGGANPMPVNASLGVQPPDQPAHRARPWWIALAGVGGLGGVVAAASVMLALGLSQLGQAPSPPASTAAPMLAPPPPGAAPALREEEPAGPAPAARPQRAPRIAHSPSAGIPELASPPPPPARARPPAAPALDRAAGGGLALDHGEVAFAEPAAAGQGATGRAGLVDDLDAAEGGARADRETLPEAQVAAKALDDAEQQARERAWRDEAADKARRFAAEAETEARYAPAQDDPSSSTRRIAKREERRQARAGEDDAAPAPAASAGPVATAPAPAAPADAFAPPADAFEPPAEAPSPAPPLRERAREGADFAHPRVAALSAMLASGLTAQARDGLEAELALHPDPTRVRQALLALHGDVSRALGKPAEAEAAWTQAAAIHRALSPPAP